MKRQLEDLDIPEQGSVTRQSLCVALLATHVLPSFRWLSRFPNYNLDRSKFIPANPSAELVPEVFAFATNMFLSVAAQPYVISPENCGAKPSCFQLFSLYAKP